MFGPRASRLCGVLLAIGLVSSCTFGDADGDARRTQTYGADDVVVGQRDGDGVVVANSWQLIGMTPDGQHLRISTFFGGVASGCSRFEGFEVDEADAEVSVTAVLWQATNRDCTDDGAEESIDIELAEPLGDRALTGCGGPDCLAPDPELRFVANPSPVAATDDGVVVGGATSLAFFDASGEPVADRDVDWASSQIAVGPAVVVSDGYTSTAYDPLTGQELWASQGWLVGSGSDSVDSVDDLGTVYLCRGEEGQGLVAVDAATGVDRWSPSGPCQVASTGDRLVGLGYDPAVDGGARLVILDAENGTVLYDEPFDDGVNDRVLGLDGLVAVGNDLVALAGGQSDLIVVNGNGDEVARHRDAIGSPIGAVAKTVIAVAHDRTVAVDAVSGDQLWQRPGDGFASMRMTGDVLVALTEDGAAVERIDPISGETMWNASVGQTAVFDAAAHGSTIYLSTTVAALALDLETGDLAWWQARPITNDGD
jgi:outer membrane protein assembly factor BamB